MANPLYTKLETVLGDRSRLLLRVLSSTLGLFALWFGLCLSALVLFVVCKVLLRVAAAHHITLNLSAFSNQGFWQFALSVGGVLIALMLITGGFLWAFLKRLRYDKGLAEDFVAYLASREIDPPKGKRSKANTAPRRLPRVFLIEGAASILDIGNTLGRPGYGLTPRQKDYLALKSDWAAVGDDLQSAVAGFEQTTSRDTVTSQSGIGEKSA